MRALLLIALILACQVPDATEIRAERACPPAWLSDAAARLEWTDLGPHIGALTIGSEIVARIDFTSDGPVLRDRAHPHIPHPRTGQLFLAPDFSLQTASTLPLTPPCTISFRGVAKHVSKSALLAQADAWLHIGNSLDALTSGGRDISASEAKSAFDLYASCPEKSDSILFEIAAFAIERLLDVGNEQLASTVSRLTSELATSTLPSEHPSTLRLELARSRLLSFSNSNRQALDIRRSLQTEIESTFGHRSEESLLNQIRIANLELELGNATYAHIALEDLVNVSNSVLGTTNSTAILATSSLANVLALEGFGNESLELLVQLKKTEEAKFGGDDRRIASIEDQAARIKLRLGRLDTALDDASEVFLWRKRHLGFANVETLESAWLLSRLYKDMGRFATARALINAILTQVDSMSSFDSKVLRPKLLGTLGSIEAGEGNLESAVIIWREVADAYAAMLGNESLDTVSAAMNYALFAILNNQANLVCLGKESFSSAPSNNGQRDSHLEAFANVLNGLCSFANAGPATQANSGIGAIEDGWHEFQALDGVGGDSTMYALSLLALANLKQGNRSLSKNYLRLMIGLAEDERADAGLGSLIRDAWFSKWVTERSKIIGYRTLALLHAEDGELDEALRIAELARDRRLHDRFVGSAELYKALPAAVFEELVELSARIGRLDEGIALTSEIVEQIEIESERTLAISALSRIKRDYVKICGCPAFQRNAESLPLPTETLSPDTAIVSIQHTDEKWWGILLRRNHSARLLRFDSLKNLGEVAQSWRRLIKGELVRTWLKSNDEIVVSFSRPSGVVGRYLSKEELGERVGRALLRPLLEASPESRRYVIVADDELSGIPFGALPVEGVAAIDLYDFAYSPSVTTYFWHPKELPNAKWDGDLFAMAADRIATSRIDSIESDSLARSNNSTASTVDYASEHPLNFARSEVEQISSLFQTTKVKVFYGPQATKDALVGASREGALKRFRYAHFAAHSVSFLDAPERSAIFLERRELSDGTSYVITAAEFANLEMNSELVVLSACNTAVGQFEPGQGLTGLAFASLAAGNHAAILTLWQISDDITEKFMVRLYKSLKKGLTPVEALSAAQREFASSSDPRLRDPAAWAAFVLYGGR